MNALSIMERQSTSSTLLLEAQAGGDSAWRTIQELYAPLVYFWCRRTGLGAADAEEIGANVLGKAFGALASFRHNGRPGAFRAWLRQITRNEVVDHRRVRLETVSLERADQAAPSDWDDSDEGTPSEEASILYHRAWEMIQAEFSPRDQDVFRRVVEGGEEPKLLAVEFGIQRSTIYSIMCRIKSRLKSRFEGMLDA